MQQNIYFVVPANSRTEAEAVAEALRVSRSLEAKMAVEVRRCGTQRKIAAVFPDGTVQVFTE